MMCWDIKSRLCCCGQTHCMMNLSCPTEPTLQASHFPYQGQILAHFSMTAHLSCCGNSFPYTTHSQTLWSSSAFTKFTKIHLCIHYLSGLLCKSLNPSFVQPCSKHSQPHLSVVSLSSQWVAGRGAGAAIHKRVSMLHSAASMGMSRTFSHLVLQRAGTFCRRKQCPRMCRCARCSRALCYANGA